MMKTKETTTCIPRKFRPNNHRNTPVTSPMSLLERFREVVLRFIMFSAISRSSSNKSSSETNSQMTTRVYPQHQDSYRNEAVDDCIQFLKQSAGGGGGSDDGIKSSSVSEDSMDVLTVLAPMSPVAGLVSNGC